MIKTPHSIEDIRTCVELYYSLNDHSLITVDKEFAFTNLYKLVRNKKFVKAIYKDNSIIAWIYADVLTHLHSREKALQQIYYASNQKGFSAARCILTLHKEIIKEAERLNLKLVISTGSHMDEDYTFTKILERAGWERRGYAAFYRLGSPGDTKAEVPYRAP
jgi:hypothetical protein